MPRLRHSFQLLALLLLVISACSSESGSTATTLAAPTPGAPVAESDYAASFDGNECAVDGPTELDPGSYSFLLTNLSDKDVDLFVIRFSPDKTLQDAFDYQGETGRWKPKPSWLQYTTDLGSSMTDAGEVFDIRLNVAGEHAVYVTTYYTAPNERQLWNCSPSFKVVENTS